MNAWLNRTVLVIGLLLGLSFLYLISSQKRGDVELEDFALGKGTATRLAEIDGVKIHCHDFNDMKLCLDGYKAIGKNPVVLWLGNSQVHAINQIKEGDETAVPFLYKELSKKGLSLVTFSQPNASLQEHFLLFEYLKNKLPIKTLILPVVFDDMRETGIRSSLTDALKDQATALSLEKTIIGQQLLIKNKDQDSAGNDMSALDDTIQEKSEKYLNSKLEGASTVWAERPKIRGQIMLSLYLFRNWALGINPSSVRKIIPSRYASNKQALETILKEANRNNISVIMYIVPLRNDVKIPYNKQEYSKFKAEIKRISLENKVYFSDLENLIPAKYWGTKDSTSSKGEQELDFMHFTSLGHKLLSEKLFHELQQNMRLQSK